MPLALCEDWQELPWTQKLQEKGLISQRSEEPLLLPLCSLRKQNKSPVKSQQQYWEDKKQALFTYFGPRVCSCSCMMQLGSTVQGALWGFYLYCISHNIFTTCFSWSKWHCGPQPKQNNHIISDFRFLCASRSPWNIALVLSWIIYP